MVVARAGCRPTGAAGRFFRLDGGAVVQDPERRARLGLCREQVAQCHGGAMHDPDLARNGQVGSPYSPPPA